ncbi:unnamed protein product [Oikopleura dioica]|uniref:Uncharacterized protein n=1 Tax=Oikopleura dioica TaxID=34765 RepID=E4XWZ5_OIKDI|nr:unnamed protein product [Oikopleura dioica]
MEFLDSHLHVSNDRVSADGSRGRCDGCKCVYGETALFDGRVYCRNCMSQNFPENKTAKFEPTDAKFKCPGKKCDADQMNILSESNELLNIEKQENVVKNVNIICCANFQCWKANNNSNNTVTDEDKTRTSCLDKLKETTTEFSIKTTTTTKMRQMPSDVFILVIPYFVKESYLQSGDGSSQILATIKASDNYYAENAAYALVNGKLHIFGGNSYGTKIARLDDCTLNELTVRLNEERNHNHAALSIENEEKALICFGYSGVNLKTCEIFDGSTTVSTFASNWTHKYGGLGLYKNQPTSVGCDNEKHQKAETLSASGWTSLPDHPKRISGHSLVGLENQSMLLIGGWDWGNGGVSQSDIWQLKDEKWNKIGELLQPAYSGSAIYIGRSIYYFGHYSKAIERLDFTETEELQSVSKIGNQQGNYNYPVLFQTVSNYCI